MPDHLVMPDLAYVVMPDFAYVVMPDLIGHLSVITGQPSVIADLIGNL